MAEAHLRVIDGNGELDEHAVAIPSDTALLIEQNAKHLRTIAALKGEITKLRKVDPQAGQIESVLEHWRTKLNHPRAQIPLDGSRAKAVKRMLALYSEDELLAALDRAAARPYMGPYGARFCCPGEGRQRRDELELLFRDERHVEQLLTLGVVEESHAEYRRWLFEVLGQHPRLVPALGLLAVREPHGDVLAAAAVWARGRVS